MFAKRGLRIAVAVGVIGVVAGGAFTPPAYAKGPSLSQRIASVQKAANAAASKLNQAESDLARAQDDIAKFKAQSASNEAKINALQTHLRSYAIREYQTGGNALHFPAVDDPSELARTRFLARHVALGSVDELESYKVLIADQADTRAALERRVRDKLAAYNQAKSLRASINTQLVGLGKAMKAQKKGLRILATGPWVCPVQGPHAFTNDWGQPRSGGRRHKGTDIHAPYGTPTVAPVAGSVVDHDSGLGGKGWFLHGVDGNTYYGAHLSRFGATGRVSQGQIIGYVGTSGNAHGGPAHLHFEIHPGNGAAVNPFGTLRAYC